MSGERPDRRRFELGSVKRLTKLILVSSICLLLATLLPLWGTDIWWVRIWDFPRLQLLLLSALLAGVNLLFLRPPTKLTWSVLFACFFCVVYQGYKVFPYTALHSVQVQSTERADSQRNIRILAANVLMKNHESQALLELCRQVNPDIILLTEPDLAWMESVAGLRESYPYEIKHPSDNTYGIALFSRFELIDPKIRFLLEDDVPSVHTKVRLPSQEIVKLYGLHPRPPAPQESDSTAQRDAELLIVAKEINKLQLPVIVVGDLNDVAWSSTTELFQEMSRLLDPRVGRGMYNTFHADIPLLRFPLDHLFHSSHFRLAEMRVLSSIGSDHFPILVNLSLEETAKSSQPTFSPGPEQAEEVEEEIRDGTLEEKEDKREEAATGSGLDSSTR
jgi:endonuclease/exonuclease/phosphatase (EEP) superfamily protein YafD